MFDVDHFRSVLGTQWLGRDLIYAEQMESTSSYLRQRDSEEVQHGLLCLTDHQTRGRGQHERSWTSQAGKNLTFTLAFKPQKAERLHVLTLACALAIAEHTEKTISRQAHLKWPNDVYVDGRKLAGFLTETVFKGSKLDRILVGVGLNVNQYQFAPELSHKATSLMLLDSEADLERELLLADLLTGIERRYEEWLNNDVDMLRAINRKIIGYGRWVRLKIDGEISKDRCKFLGINEKGELVVLWQTDVVKTYSYEQIRIIPD